MKVSVDAEKCIGCGACVSMCSGVFEMKEGKSVVKDDADFESCDCKAAAGACPVEAITVEE